MTRFVLDASAGVELLLDTAQRNVMTRTQADDAFRMLERSIFNRAQVRPLLPDAWRRREAMTVADALYVALAEHLVATLVTADIRLAGAPSLGLPTIVP